jgi:amidase
VPEFGAGSHTFNPVFGPTRNPYDLQRSAGGSSGGGAAALAAGMVSLADGSDLGGSVRNPPSFNNVVGLRPSPGRIPDFPRLNPWSTLPVLGPMARSVADVALMLSVMAGPDLRDPLSIAEDGRFFRERDLQRDFSDVKIAWSRDLGQFPVDSAVAAVIEDALPIFETLGCEIEEIHPDFSGAAEIFQTLRAYGFAAGLQNEYQNQRQALKDTVIWNIERGLALSALEVAQAQIARGQLFQRMSKFMTQYSFLLLPVSQVPPFPIEVDWVRQINGQQLETYIDWMQSCSLITLTEHPVAAVPAGFTPAGLPIGLQIVGRFRHEFEVLQLAQAFEQAAPYGQQRPKL